MAPPGSEQYVTALGFLADTLLASERFEEAATSYRAFVDARPREVAAVINLGVAFAQLGRRAEALAAFNRALQLDPGNATALRNITLAREELRGAR